MPGTNSSHKCIPSSLNETSNISGDISCSWRVAWSQTEWPFLTECSFASVVRRKQDGSDSRISATLEPQLFRPSLPYATSPFHKVGGEPGVVGCTLTPWPYLMDLCVTFQPVMFKSCRCSSCPNTCFFLRVLIRDYVSPRPSALLGFLFIPLLLNYCNCSAQSSVSAMITFAQLNEYKSIFRRKLSAGADSFSIQASHFWLHQSK